MTARGADLQTATAFVAAANSPFALLMSPPLRPGIEVGCDKKVSELHAESQYNTRVFVFLLCSLRGSRVHGK